MNSAHWHLLFNHFPIISSLIGLFILIAGFFFKQHVAIKRTALGVFILSALAGIQAFLSGEGAEEIIENIDVINKVAIEDHEYKGKLFFILIEILGGWSLFTLYLDLKTRKSVFLYVLTLVFAACAVAVGIPTGLSGGKIRHTEIDTANPVKVQVTTGAEEERDD